MQRLKEEQIEVGRQLEKEGQQKEAEQYYCAAGEWRAALTMYEGVEMWDEAIRVAKVHGGREQANGVAFKWARSLGGEQGSKLLQNLGLVREAIEYHQKLREFPHAFELAERCLPEMLPEVRVVSFRFRSVDFISFVALLVAPFGASLPQLSLLLLLSFPLSLSLSLSLSLFLSLYSA